MNTGNGGEIWESNIGSKLLKYRCASTNIDYTFIISIVTKIVTLSLRVHFTDSYYDYLLSLIVNLKTFPV